MTVLSDVDIKNEIGVNILVYPYRNKNLKGASYNLTASKLAWDLSTKTSLYDSTKNKIIIPKRTTALIETFETVWVSKKICGTYHSKVYQVSRGTGHIGTTLDPNYIGPSLLAVHNHSDELIELVPEEDSFVTIAFQYVNTESSVEQHGNFPGRIEILNQVGIQPSVEEQRWLDQSFMNNREALRAELDTCADYQTIKEGRTTKAIKISFQHLLIVLGIITFVVVIAGATLAAKRVDWQQKPWYTPVNFTVEKSIEAIAIVWITLLTNRILNQRK